MRRVKKSKLAGENSKKWKIIYKFKFINILFEIWLKRYEMLYTKFFRHESPIILSRLLWKSFIISQNRRITGQKSNIAKI